jgi:hypothetical protein
MPVNVGAPPLPPGEDYIRLFDRVMECAGSMSNRGNFVFAHKDINYVKSRVSYLRSDACRTLYDYGREANDYF